MAATTSVLHLGNKSAPSRAGGGKEVLQHWARAWPSRNASSARERSLIPIRALEDQLSFLLRERTDQTQPSDFTDFVANLFWHRPRESKVQLRGIQVAGFRSKLSDQRRGWAPLIALISLNSCCWMPVYISSAQNDCHPRCQRTLSAFL